MIVVERDTDSINVYRTIHQYRSKTLVVSPLELDKLITDLQAVQQQYATSTQPFPVKNHD